MLFFSIVRVFIAARSVKLVQSCFVLREMSRNPVENDADTGFVEHIYHFPEIVRRSVA